MKSVEHTRSFEAPAPVAEVFPLFSPEGEKRWVPEWDYENVMGTTTLCEDYVFLTTEHAHGATAALWLVKRYDPQAHSVEFYKIEPGVKVGVIKVRCTAIGEHRTGIAVTYKYVALSPAGEAFVSEFTRGAYAAFIEQWRTLLSDYFTGERGGRAG